MSRIYISTNSAGGVSIHPNFYNSSDKIITYITLSVIPFNRVGDLVSSQIGLRTEAGVRLTGPLQPRTMTGRTRSNLWYNSTISCVEITSIEIIFSDGTSETYDKTEVKEILSENNSNSCAVYL